MSDPREYLKMQKQLAILKKELAKYQRLFEEDGHIDTEEQRQLNAMQDVIRKAEAKLTEQLEGAPINDHSNPQVEPDDKDDYTYQKVMDPQTNAVVQAFRKGNGDSTDVHWNDVAQGQLGDCYFLSAIGAVAKADPSALKKLIDGPDAKGNYKVTLHIDDSFLFFSYKTTKTVTVTPEFLVDANGNPAYAGKGDVELWVMLLEKAYAIIRKEAQSGNKRVQNLPDGYGSLRGGIGTEGIEVLTGKEADYLWLKNMSDDEVKETISDALKEKRAITTGTIQGYDKKKGEKPTQKQLDAESMHLVLGHEYFIIGFDGSKVHVQNPWNAEINDGDGRGDLQIALADYKKYFYNICVQQ